jgi:hypothetical protein
MTYNSDTRSSQVFMISLLASSCLSSDVVVAAVVVVVVDVVVVVVVVVATVFVDVVVSEFSFSAKVSFLPGEKVLKLFSSSLTKNQNKLECLYFKCLSNLF